MHASRLRQNCGAVLMRTVLEPDPERRFPKQQVPDCTAEEVKEASLEKIFQKGMNGNTLLHDFVKFYQMEFVTILVGRIPSSSFLDIRNDFGRTPLHMATRSRRADIVRTLVCAGADTRIQDCLGNTPLHVAVAMGDIASVRALTSPVTPEEIQKVNLLYVPIIPPISLPEDHGAQGYTCLHMATIGRYIDILKYLVEDLQTDVDVTDIVDRSTSLHFACVSGFEDIVIYLLNLGAYHSYPNIGGLTPLRCATEHPFVQNILLAHGAGDEEFHFNIEDDVEDDDFNATAHIKTSNAASHFHRSRS